MESSHQFPPKRWFVRALLVYAGIVAVAIAGLLLVTMRRSRQPAVAPEFLNGFTALIGQQQASSPFTGELVPSYAPTLGPADAPITIVEFADFQCPYCRASVYPVRQLLREYPNQIRLVFRHFPIRSVHALAETAALAGTCAHDQGKFWALHDAVYNQQDSLTRESLDAIAQSVGLDMNRFDLCLSNRTFLEYVQRDFSDGVQLGARGTPTWIINGQTLQGALPLQTWKQVIDSLISQ